MGEYSFLCWEENIKEERKAEEMILFRKKKSLISEVERKKQDNSLSYHKLSLGEGKWSSGYLSDIFLLRILYFKLKLYSSLLKNLGMPCFHYSISSCKEESQWSSQILKWETS